MQRDEALRILREHRDELRREFAVSSLSIFGSVARDEARPESDVDMLVEFVPGSHPTLFTLAGLHAYLEEVLGCSVDLGERGTLRPQIARYALKDEIHAFAGMETAGS